MHKLLVLPVALLTLGAASLLAQESPATGDAESRTVLTKPEAATGGDVEPRVSRVARPARVAASPTPVATPTPKKRGFFRRIFGGREPAATPPAATPAPATPRPVRRPPRKPDPEPETVVKPEAAATPHPKSATPIPEPTQPEKPAEPEKPEKPAEPEVTPTLEKPVPPEVQPEPVVATPTPGKKGAKGKPVKAAATPKPAPEVKGPSKEEIALKQAIAGGDPEIIEKAKYQEAKARAGEDSRLKELKQKADEAPNEEEGRKALRAYNKALFQKMRSLEPDIKERADRMEAAVLKQLDAPGGE